MFIVLSTRLPDLQDRFDLDPGSFSLLVFGLVLGAGAGSLSAERAAARFGSAAPLRAGFAVMVLAVPTAGLTHQLWLLVVAMVCYGYALGLVDAATNMQGVAVEHAYARTIMPTFHACWTIGGIVGTLFALALSGASLGINNTVVATLPLLALALPFLPAERPSEIDSADTSAAAAIPWRRILLVGAALTLFYMVDTAVTTWAPTYLDKTFHSSDALVAVAALPYLVASLVSRGSGDRMAARFGPSTLIRVGAVAGALGLVIVVASPVVVLVLVGFVVLGLGVAVIAPLSYSAAASIARDGEGRSDRARVDAVIARFNQFNYLGAVLGSVMTGAVGKDSLRYGFAVPAVLILGVVPLAAAFALRASPTV